MESPNSRETQESFVSKLAESLHRYGTSSHELEEILQTCSDALGLNAAFFSTPTAIFISFPESPDNRSILKRVSPGEIDLEKLVAVDKIVTRFLQQKQTLESATQELEQLENRPASFPSWVYVLGFGVASGTVVGFLLGGLREILVTSIIGVLVGALEQLARRHPDFGRAYCAIASFAAAFLAVAASRCLPGLS
ncbi:MAG: threonine/serine exporter family protein, partial [Planctomycetota bacterium]|nr:threonine/serine exporter family protein [Planctomycetota bacterium]